MSEISVFNFNAAAVRVVKSDDGEPWFVAKDVAEILGYSETAQMTKRLDDDEKTTLPFRQTGSNYQTNMVFVNESGLYNAIIGSKKPEAKKFRKWVTSEVLPAIRRDGGYVAAGAGDSDEVLMARALKAADAALKRKDAEINRKNEMLGAANEEIKALAPDAEYARTVLDADGTCTANIIAAQLGTTAIMLNRFLCEQRVTYRQGGVVLPCADARRRGLCKIHTIPYACDDNGNVKCSNHTKWTEAGRRYIVDLWRSKKGV